MRLRRRYPKETPIKLERHSRSENIEGEYFGPVGSGYSDYGPIRTEYDLSPGAKVYRGKSSLDLAEKAGYYDQELPPDMQKKYDIKKLSEASDKQLNAKGGTIWGDNPNTWWRVFQEAAERYLKARGYQGAFWRDEDEISPKQYQIWDKKAIKKEGK